MACETVLLPGGGRAIVCGPRSRRRCACGRAAPLLCDWKVPGSKTGTCDEPLCNRCTTSPAPEKDLCEAHAGAFRAWQAERALRAPAGSGAATRRPLPNPDAPAVATAGVSAPEAARSGQRASGRSPEAARA